MGDVSYSAHISNGASAIKTKEKLKGVANHNLRKYKSSSYDRSMITILVGSDNLYQDVQEVYRREFDEALEAYNQKQKRPERRIEDYFEHVSNQNKDMAVEMIVQLGDKDFWDEFRTKHLSQKKDPFVSQARIETIYRKFVNHLGQELPDFKIASAVVHYDEASPHMHIVGVPVGTGYKRGLSVQVSKRKVFTSQVLENVLQGTMRSITDNLMNLYFHENLKDKKTGRNEDLTVTEYKVAQELQKLNDTRNKQAEAEREVASLEEELRSLTKDVQEGEKAWVDLYEKNWVAKAAFQKLSKRNEELQGTIRDGNHLLDDIQGKCLSLENKYLHLNGQIKEKESYASELAAKISFIEDACRQMEQGIERMKQLFVSLKLNVPIIGMFASLVEREMPLETRQYGEWTPLGKLLFAFKEVLSEGLCWFPRLMHWHTTIGDVAPIFMDYEGADSYELMGFCNIHTGQQYMSYSAGNEICERNRSDEFEQMLATVEALVSTLEMIQFNNNQMERLKLESDFLDQVKREHRQRDWQMKQHR